MSKMRFPALMALLSALAFARDFSEWSKLKDEHLNDLDAKWRREDGAEFNVDKPGMVFVELFKEANDRIIERFERQLKQANVSSKGRKISKNTVLLSLRNERQMGVVERFLKTVPDLVDWYVAGNGDRVFVGGAEEL